MHQRKIVDGLLWVLLAVGFFGAAKVSLANFAGTACPHIWLVPVCYVVLAGYALMIASLLVRHNGCKHYFFCIGWGTVFVIALLASIAEFLGGGGVCPSTGDGSVRGVSSGAIPMCYISLALALGILVLFLIGPYKRACDACNAQQ